MNYPKLFSPIKINQLTIRNRILSTAHAEVYGEGGKVSDRYIRYYQEKAKGGLALAICGGSSPVSRDSPAAWWQSINLSTDECKDGLNKLAEAMHQYNAKIMIQITHMGRRSNYFGFDWPYLLSPSGIREPVHRGVAKTIEYHEIKRIIQDYANAALRVKESGMDGIEVSAAHQHLIDQFWSPRVNHRLDEYGGSLENRMRFGMQVLEAIREKVGSEFCVGMRMSGDEFHSDGLTHDNLKEIASRLSDSRLIDFLSVVGSGADTHNTIANCMPPMELPPEPFIHLAAGIKSVINIPLMHAQSIKDATQAERILEKGWVDMVGMTRAHIADPYIVNKIAQGQEDQIKQCVGANYCIDRQYNGLDVLCIQNAATSREKNLSHNIKPTQKAKKKVVVVGAGVSGLEAARVSASLGHQVVLFEANNIVGGQVNLAAKAPKREQMAGIIRWFDLEIKRLKVDLRLNTKATKKMILAEKPQVVIIATGGSPHILDKWKAKGKLYVSSWDILDGTHPIQGDENVLVYDENGQHAGALVANFIAEKGAIVEIVTPEPFVAADTGGTTFPIMYRNLYANGVIQTANFQLEKIYQDHDEIIAVIENEYTYDIQERVVDLVVIENGTTPNDELYFELKNQSINSGEIDLDALYDFKAQPCLDTNEAIDGFALFRIGEAVCPRNIHGSIYDALRLCKDI